MSKPKSKSKSNVQVIAPPQTPVKEPAQKEEAEMKKDKKDKKVKKDKSKSKAEKQEWSLADKKKETFDSELDNLFSSAPIAPASAPSTSTTPSLPTSKHKRPAETGTQPLVQSESAQSATNEKKSKKARKSLDQEKQKEDQEAALVERRYQQKKPETESKGQPELNSKGKAKAVEFAAVPLEKEEMEVDGADDAIDADEEVLQDESEDIEALESEDEDSNAPPPVHESLLKDAKTSGKSSKKSKDDDEPREEKDKRTLFVGNLPIEAVKSRAITKALKRHFISLSPYPSLTSISSIRYRSIPFSTPTDDFVAGDDEASTKAAKRRERTATYREAQALADKEEKGDDADAASNSQAKNYLNSRQKRKVAFIKQDFNSHASSVNAYVTLSHVDLEELKKLREQPGEEQSSEKVPVPPASLTGPLLASLLSHTSNNTVFQKRHLRVDMVTPLSVNDLLQSGLEKTSSLFKAMVPSTSASNSASRGGSAPIGRDERKTLFVGNLDFEASEEDLRDFFEDLMIQERGNPPENEGGKSLRSLVFERKKEAKRSALNPDDTSKVQDEANEKAKDDDDADSDSEDGEDESDEYSSSWVSSVRIIRDPSTQLGKGFAYVLFKDEICVDELMALHETEEAFLESGRPQAGGLRGKGKSLVPPPSSYGKEFRRKLKFKKRPLRLSRCKATGSKGGSGSKDSRNAAGNFSRPKNGSEPVNSASKRDGPRGASNSAGASGNRAKPNSSTYDGPKASSLDSTLLSSLSKEERANLKKNDPGRLARRLEKKNNKKSNSTRRIENLDEEGRKVGQREKVNLNRHSIAGGKGKGKGKDGKDGKKRSSTGAQALGKKNKNPGRKPVSKK